MNKIKFLQSVRLAYFMCFFWERGVVLVVCVCLHVWQRELQNSMWNNFLPPTLLDFIWSKITHLLLYSTHTHTDTHRHIRSVSMSVWSTISISFCVQYAIRFIIFVRFCNVYFPIFDYFRHKLKVVRFVYQKCIYSHFHFYTLTVFKSIDLISSILLYIIYTCHIYRTSSNDSWNIQNQLNRINFMCNELLSAILHMKV